MILPSLINTSNINKQKEFKHLFGLYNHTIEFVNNDIDEIVADPITVVVHKAVMAGQNIFVEDTSLDVQGHDFGIAIKHKIKDLEMVIGCKALWNVYMAFCHGDQVFVFKGTISGTIGSKKGESGFGFDPYFIPDGCTKSLAEEKLDECNARAVCVAAIMNGDIFALEPIRADFYEFNFQKK
jgi:XTP/dITP diphosphohydrolase